MLGDDIVIGRSLHLPSEILEIDPLNDRVQPNSGQFHIGHQTSYRTYTLSVRGPFADMEEQSGSFDDRILADSENFP